MNGVEEESAPTQTFLYGCVLEAGKEVVFNPEDDEFEHQLDLRMICVDSSTKDELHIVEVEGQDAEGQKVKAVLASLKPSSLPSVCLGGFCITPPTVFRLKAGSGPVHISGQHLVVMDGDQSFDEEDDDDEEEEEEEEDMAAPKKRPASSPAVRSQKKIKMEVDDEDDDDDDDDEDDDDEEEEDDEDEEEEEAEEEKTPVKAKQAPSKKKAPAQNGKSSDPGTPAQNREKTPKGKGDKAKSPTTPKATLTLPEVKAKMMEAVKKGVSLPKVKSKFENLMTKSYKVSDAKDISELWEWRQNLKEAK